MIVLLSCFDLIELSAAARARDGAAFRNAAPHYAK